MILQFGGVIDDLSEKVIFCDKVVNCYWGPVHFTPAHPLHLYDTVGGVIELKRWM